MEVFECVLSAPLGELASLTSIGGVGLPADTHQHGVRVGRICCDLAHSVSSFCMAYCGHHKATCSMRSRVLFLMLFICLVFHSSLPF